MRGLGKNKGFTMVELSLSVVFISMLSIAIVLIITNAVSAYHRGLTLNKVNNIGMEIEDDIVSAIQSSSGRSVVAMCVTTYSDTKVREECENDRARNFVSITRNAEVIVGNNSIGEVPVFGAFCSGTYSYIWNSGYFFSEEARIPDFYDNNGAEINYSLYGGTSEGAQESNARGFKLLKIKDESRAVCKTAINALGKDKENYSVNGTEPISNKFDITSYGAIDEEPVDLLSTSADNNLAIYDLNSTAPAENGLRSNLLYSMSFILGTVQGGININSAGNSCATPNGYNSSVANFDYCAINKFNFAVQATGG